MMGDARNHGYAGVWAAASECGATARQLPFILFTTWWNAIGVADLIDQPRHHAGPASDHALTVPAPIEDEGEHALFA
jgi:hypothetical protein